jgi:hypothetical protein
MEHAKKMMLVDPLFARPSMRDKSLSALDMEIANTLDSDEPDDVKAKRYTMTLNRFKFHEEIPKPSLNPMEKLESTVLQSVPPKQQYKAKRVMDMLKSNSEVDFNDPGELIYRQSRVPSSSIVDLIEDLTRTKSIETPVGWEALAESLKASKAPREIVSNTRSWNFMRDPTPRRKDKGKHKWVEY